MADNPIPLLCPAMRSLQEASAGSALPLRSSHAAETAAQRRSKRIGNNFNQRDTNSPPMEA